VPAPPVGEILRHLAAVIGGDTVGRELQRLERGFGAGILRGGELGLGNPHRLACEFQPVETARQLDDRIVAACPDIGEDRRHAIIDIGLKLALCRQQTGEGGGKTGDAGVEPKRHPRPRETARSSLESRPRGS
jgi:hypothetical protein